MTKTAFMAAYRKLLVEEYDWARDEILLDRFMDGVTRTLTTNYASWAHDSPMVTRAWRAIGGKGKATLKALRALA